MTLIADIENMDKNAMLFIEKIFQCYSQIGVNNVVLYNAFIQPHNCVLEVFGTKFLCFPELRISPFSDCYGDL